MLSVEQKPVSSGLYVPNRVTADDPIVFTLRLREGKFSFSLSAMITEAIIGRRFTQSVEIEGHDVVLTWRIGPSEEFWLSPSWKSNQRVRRELEAVLGLARVVKC